MHMRIDKARADQRFAVIGHSRVRMCGPQIIGQTNCRNAITDNQDRPASLIPHRIGPRPDQGIARKAQGLSKKELFHHCATIWAPLRAVNH
jgi:hypothetical protein